MSIKVNELFNYCEAKNIKIETEFYYNENDVLRNTFGLELEREIIPEGVMIGFEYKKHNYVWFKYYFIKENVNANTTIEEIMKEIENNYCGFNHFYNCNTGAKRSGFKCGFNFEMKVERFLSENK